MAKLESFLPIFTSCALILRIAPSLQSEAQGRNALMKFNCSSDSDCIFPKYDGVITEATCLSRHCECKSNETVLAQLSLSRAAFDNLNASPVFRGFLLTSMIVCAPKAETPCGGPAISSSLIIHCSPGSFCSLKDINSTSGTCKCSPNRRLVNATGICECNAGYVENSAGICEYTLPENCTKSSNKCGPSADKLGLECKGDKCECRDTNTTWGTAFPSIMGTNGELNLQPEIQQQMCLPLPGQPCTGTGLCAPRAFCKYESAKNSTSQGICTCTANSFYSNKSRQCTCNPGFKSHRNAHCVPEDSQPCNSTRDCPQTWNNSFLQSPHKCFHGYCICDPKISVLTNISQIHYDSILLKKSPSSSEGTICAIMPEQSCGSTPSICAPGSRCIGIQGDFTCKCDIGLNRVLSNATGLCACAQGYSEDAKNKSCVPLKPTILCSPGSSNCDKKNVTTCPQHSSPSKEQAGCSCDFGFRNTSGSCEKIYKSNCSQDADCHPLPLTCRENTCQCQFQKQYFNETALTCISVAGGQCHRDAVCTSYSNCRNETCVCKPSFAPDDSGVCLAEIGTTCSLNMNGPKCVLNATCQGGRCAAVVKATTTTTATTTTASTTTASTTTASTTTPTTTKTSPLTTSKPSKTFPNTSTASTTPSNAGGQAHSSLSTKSSGSPLVVNIVIIIISLVLLAGAAVFVWKRYRLRSGTAILRNSPSLVYQSLQGPDLQL